MPVTRRLNAFPGEDETLRLHGCGGGSIEQARRSARLFADTSGVRAVEPWSFEVRGRFEEHTFQSQLLRGNPLGDPHERPLWVYLPPGYDEDPNARFPSVYLIQGLT